MKSALDTREQIISTLTETFAPSEVVLEDVSERHKGHAGYREGGQSHFRLRIVAQVFAGRRPIERHRMINGAIKELFDSERLHALTIKALTPDEANREG